jgi:hypothetical protein
MLPDDVGWIGLLRESSPATEIGFPAITTWRSDR